MTTRQSIWKLIVLLVATVLVLGFICYLEYRLRFLEDLSNYLTGLWSHLSEEAQNTVIIGAIISVVLGTLSKFGRLLISYVKTLFRGSKQPNTTIFRDQKFPFEQFSSTTIDELKERRIPAYLGADVPYQSRFALDGQGHFEKEADDCKLLLLTGRHGIGKTRECIEFFCRLARKKGEEVTILLAREDFDRPEDTTIPTNLVPSTLIIFIDRIEEKCGDPSKGKKRSDSATRDFHDRLSATIEWMRERYSGIDCRVVLTACDEPRYLERLKFDALREMGFNRTQLPPIHQSVLRGVIGATANRFHLDLSDRNIGTIARKSDGTFPGIVTAFAREAERRRTKPLTPVEDWISQYSFRYPQDWKERIYREEIEPYPEREIVLRALSILHKLRISPPPGLVVELAARIYQGNRFYRFAKRKMSRVIRHDLQSLVSEVAGSLTCQIALLNEDVDLKSTASQVVSSLQSVIHQRQPLEQLLPTLTAVASHLSEEAKSPEEAIRLLNSVTRLVPHDSELEIAKAALLGQAGHWRESLDIARAAVEADARNSRAFIALAFAQDQNGEHDEAVESAKRATEVAPKDDFAWLNLGVVLNKRGNSTQAIKALQEACRLNRFNAKAWSTLGLVYDNDKQYKRAIEACVTATRLDPNNPEPWHTLGIAYDRDGNAEKAVEVLRYAHKLDSGSASILISLSIAFEKASHFADAVQAARSALRIAPKHFYAQRLLASMLGGIPGKEFEALEESRKLAEMEKTGTRWKDLSDRYNRKGLYEEALKCADMALCLDQDFCLAWYNRAVNLEKCDRYAEAPEAWKRFNKLGPGITEAILNLDRQYIESDPYSRERWKKLARDFHFAARVKDAMSIALSAVKRDASVAPGAFEVANELLSAEPSAGEELLSYLVSIDNKNPRYVFLRGVARRKLKEFHGAIDDIRFACNADPRDGNKWYALGQVLKDVGSDEASAAYKEASILGHKRAHFALGMLAAKDS